MAKAVLFIFLCALVTLACVVLMAIIGNRGLGGIAIQEEATPTIWWTAPVAGASAGMILAIANLVGRMPRLRWRSILGSYSALPGLFVLLEMILEIGVRPVLAVQDGFVVSYTYFSPEPDFAYFYYGVIVAIAVGVVLLRRRAG